MDISLYYQEQGYDQRIPHERDRSGDTGAKLVNIKGDHFIVVRRSLEFNRAVGAFLDPVMAMSCWTFWRRKKRRSAGCLQSMNSMRIQFVQNLHKLQMMERHISTNFIPSRRHILMTMNDWKTKLDAFLMFNDADLLQNKGTVTAVIAKQFAESEFEKYRIIQDNIYKSDFDRLILEEEDLYT